VRPKRTSEFPTFGAESTARKRHDGALSTRPDASNGHVRNGHNGHSEAPASAGISGDVRYDVLRLVPVTSEDFIAILSRAGFRPVQVRLGATWIWMERTGTAVRVPIRDVLPPDELLSLLRAARLSVAELLQGLEELSRRA
jgi:hypothetical protein